MKRDVIVVGSGISGLTCAAVLAGKGLRVTVLERQSKPGGVLRRFKRNGIPFDIGFHYTGCLGKGEILDGLWRYIGLLPSLPVIPFPAAGNDSYTLQSTGRTVRYFFQQQLLQEELLRLFPVEKRGITAYFRALTDFCKTIPFFNPDLEITPFLRGFAPPVHSLADFLTGITANPELQAVLAAPCFLYGVPPRKTSREVHFTVVNSFINGAYAIDGGGQTICDGILDRLQSAGAEVICGQAVSQLQVRNGRVAGVVAGDSSYEAANVVFTGHPANLLDLVDDGAFRPAYRSRLKGLPPTVSMFAVFGEYSQSPEHMDLTWTNHYSLPSGLDILDVNCAAPEKSGMLLTAPGRRDQNFTLSNGGGGVILMRSAKWQEVEQFDNGPGEKRLPGYQEWKNRAADKLLQQVEKYWSIRGIRPLASSSPLTFRDHLASPRGGVYGPQHNLDGYNPGARTKLPGLWLSGQATLMTGIVGSSLAGLVTAGEVMNNLEALWGEVRECL